MGYTEWNKDGKGCDSCIKNKECSNDIEYLKFADCNAKTAAHYVSTNDISAMVEWAEAWSRRDGGLVVCENTNKTCTNNCDYKHPFKYKFHNDPLRVRCVGGKYDIIAYRGNPEAKEVEAPKEYVCVESFNLAALAASDISGEIFKEIFKKQITINIQKGELIQFLSIVYGYAEEFMKLGFIEEKVHDPVVEAGDCFTGTYGYYKIIKYGSNSYHLINLTGADHYALPYCSGDLMFSMIPGSEKLKPCKIKITEVKDGE